jgi:hypothetical protein
MGHGMSWVNPHYLEVIREKVGKQDRDAVLKAASAAALRTRSEDPKASQHKQHCENGQALVRHLSRQARLTRHVSRRVQRIGYGLGVGMHH